MRIVVWVVYNMVESGGCWVTVFGTRKEALYWCKKHNGDMKRKMHCGEFDLELGEYTIVRESYYYMGA